MYVNVSSFWQYKLFVDIHRLFSENYRQTGVVEIDEFTGFLLLYLCKFQK